MPNQESPLHSERTEEVGMPRRRDINPRRTPKEPTGTRIARLRRSRGLTQVQLAEKLRISQALLSHYERSRRGLDSNVVAELAQIFGVSADEILGLRELRRKPDPGIQPRFLRKLLQLESLSKRDQNALFRTIDGFIRGRSQLRKSA